ncbi:MAG: SIR2 family NAD-dependent protein deacylase [Caldisericia bacterium]
MDNNLIKLKELIENSQDIYAITGAGISTNAGLPDFRGPKGIYKQKNIDPDKIFDINYFLINPEYFYNFIKDFIQFLDKIEPTFTHKFLFKLEKLNKLKGLITQNIDTLHERAGNKNIITIHGSIEKFFCIECFKNYNLKEIKEKIFNEKIPKCDLCDGLIRPDIVFYGENVKNYDLAVKWVSNADLLLVIGTSLKVFPASYLPSITKGKVVIINKGDISLSHLNRYIFINEDIDEFFSKLDEILKLEVNYD